MIMRFDDEAQRDTISFVEDETQTAQITIKSSLYLNEISLPFLKDIFPLYTLWEILCARVRALEMLPLNLKSQASILELIGFVYNGPPAPTAVDDFKNSGGRHPMNFNIFEDHLPRLRP